MIDAHLSNTIPHDADFALPNDCPKPMIHGLQTAIVQGPSGDEIYTDCYGRVKVKFHWDRNPDGLNPEALTCWIRKAEPWTGRAPLPGGDIEGADFERFLADLKRRRPWLPPDLARRYARAYGTRVGRLLDGARGLGDLGEDLGGGLHEAEVEYLRREEWALTADDVLWRRSKLGLHVSDETRGQLLDWLERQRTAAGSRMAVS